MKLSKPARLILAAAIGFVAWLVSDFAGYAAILMSAILIASVFKRNTAGRKENEKESESCVSGMRKDNEDKTRRPEQQVHNLQEPEMQEKVDCNYS